MNPRIYNAALAVGVVLISIGVGLVSVPAGLVAAGSLIVALTLVGAHFAARKGR